MAIWGNILTGKPFKTSFLMVFHVTWWTKAFKTTKVVNFEVFLKF